MTLCGDAPPRWKPPFDAGIGVVVADAADSIGMARTVSAMVVVAVPCHDAKEGIAMNRIEKLAVELGADCPNVRNDIIVRHRIWEVPQVC